MGKVYESIVPKLRRFIEAQQMFFVGTAPLSEDGHINVSPKGGVGTWVVLDERRVAYLDLTGSGAETLAHLRENRRIVLMWCAFTGPPQIVRVHGTGRVVVPEDREFGRLRLLFPDLPGVRSIIVVDATRVSDSCGYSVPRYDHAGPREALTKWADKRGPDGIAAFQRERNAVSIDGLVALPTDGTSVHD